MRKAGLEKKEKQLIKYEGCNSPVFTIPFFLFLPFENVTFTSWLFTSPASPSQSPTFDFEVEFEHDIGRT